MLYYYIYSLMTLDRNKEQYEIISVTMSNNKYIPFKIILQTKFLKYLIINKSI